MLGEYFGMDISNDGYLHTLPQVIDDYPPDIDRLPHSILRPGRDIDWESEETCF